MTMPLNLFKSKGKLGIDIGTSAIKVVELELQNGRFVLTNYATHEIKSHGAQDVAGSNLMDLSDEELAQAIKGLIEKAGMKSRDAVMSISSFATFATVIRMSYLNEEDLAKSVPFEARKYVPIPMDQVVLDWSIIGVAGEGEKKVEPEPQPSSQGEEGEPEPEPEAKPKTGTTVEVFLAAVPKDETARYQHIAKAAGLNLVALELENSSLIRGLLGNDLSPTAIVNAGGRSTSILIAHKGYERLSHNYEIGGFEITKAIAKALNMDLDQAEAMKRKYGLLDSPENKAKAPMHPLVDMMLFETKKTVSGYEEGNKVRVPRVVLIGGVSNMPGLASHFKQKLDRDVLVGNVFARVIHPPELAPIISSLSNTFAIAVGAAMRET
jgi:type IV pilus assembly protein PilM